MQELSIRARSKLDAYAPVPRTDWPDVIMLSSLDGHRGDIRSIRFSHSGACVATACADGQVRLFSPARNAEGGAGCRSSPAAAAAASRCPQAVDLDAGPRPWVSTLTMVCNIQAQARGQQRRRGPPKAPEVQQIVWGLDDLRVMAAASDYTVRVFDARDGKQLQVLGGHSRALYELAAHPWVPGIVATWSHDGTICIHDVETGQKLTGFDIRHTYPGHGLWCSTEPICLLDGCWTPSGDALLTTDVAGQYHVFEFGPADLRSRAHYDQFLRSDYEPLCRDNSGAVVDAASGRPAHLAGDRRVCTSFMVPYEDPYQSLARRNLLSASALVSSSSLLRCSLPRHLGSHVLLRRRANA